MITAKEARTLTEQSSAEMISTYCEEAIKEAISQGKYKATIDLSRSADPYAISRILINGLEELGYKASYETGCQWDPAYDLIIEW